MASYKGKIRDRTSEKLERVVRVNGRDRSWGRKKRIIVVVGSFRGSIDEIVDLSSARSNAELLIEVPRT